jgi:hypothetical protein
MQPIHFKATQRIVGVGISEIKLLARQFREFQAIYALS